MMRKPKTTWINSAILIRESIRVSLASKNITSEMMEHAFLMVSQDVPMLILSMRKNARFVWPKST